MIKIFFSWQSDISQDVTTRIIRSAIAKAAAAMTGKYGVPVVPDEATRDVAGAPYIPAKLAEKIRVSDIFVGDITSIAISPDGKSLPNANVTFELGLAAAHLGWDRIILFFNEGIAEFSNLPFDFDRHRISKFKIADDKNSILSQQKPFDDLVRLAFDTIIDQKPLRPRELEGKSETQIKHDRDVINLRWFFRHMSVDALGKHIDEMPAFLHYFAPVMHDGLNDVVKSPSFRLYNSDLEATLRALVSDLGDSLAHDQHYRELTNIWVQAFGRRDPYADHQAERAAAETIKGNIQSLDLNLRRAVDIIRANYLEVDLDKLSQDFMKQYRGLIETT